MANENAEKQRELEEIQKEIEEAQKEYEELMKETDAETVVAESEVGTTEMHIFNISIAVIMIIIGGILAYQSRNVTQKQKSGKKIAGWILLVLGVLTVIVHVTQLIS